MDERQYYLPTPEEIQEMCRDIRSSWSEEEHRIRAGIADRFSHSREEPDYAQERELQP